MAFKSVPLIKAKLFKNTRGTSQRLEKNKVRASIEAMCQEYLKDYNDVLTFEALPNAIDATLEVIEEPALADKYDFFQYSETLFQVKLKEFDLLS